VTEKRTGVWFSIRWWSRWLVRHFPGAAYRRFRVCRKEGHEWGYDGTMCDRCYYPWTQMTLSLTLLPVVGLVAAVSRAVTWAKRGAKS